MMGNVDQVGMFMLGLLGTGHCVGMCGPLIFAFPGRTGRLMPHMWYHLGRITTYSTVGAILGGVSQLLVGAEVSAGAGSTAFGKLGLLLLAAVFLLLFGFARVGVLREPGWLRSLSPARIPGFKSTLQEATEGKRCFIFFWLGILLGFLPCGLSYGAFAVAFGTSSAVQGGLAVLVFGAGTVPGLILLGTGASAIFSRYRRQSDILSGVLMILMAIKMGHNAVRMVFG
jgi:sulfite exporter TauE/SafE